jgi:hypothetical protein
MTISIELTPEEEARLLAAARRNGMELAECARFLVTQQLPALDAEAQDALTLLRQWEEEDRTSDPDAIRQAQVELQEFEQAMNTPRAESGSRLLYP